ncbi:ciliary neurotrophic factor-like [Scyliorhinus canicula]|uniref:ciliary neurotrophic factor-like n=1 Tax=Scyliorhinus canicula TaxID=7830 RepID=UPI0018F5AAFF|nr:ciliary neurotrophic factor-like [Scyliorhinus canicula]
MAARTLLGTARVHRNTLIETLKSCIELGRNLRPKADETMRLYDQCQGLTDKMTSGLTLSEADGIPLAGTSRWAELSDQERVNENFRAYKVFSSYLRLVLKNVPDCARYPRLPDSVMDLCTKAESMLVLISQLLMTMGLPVPAVRVPLVEAPKDWDKKIWGHKVLRELGNWSLRSVRDFNKLKTNLSASRARRRHLRGAQLR